MTSTQTDASEIIAGAILTIDIAALRENYRILKARLGNTDCAGVIKADGYGVGAVAVADALSGEGCSHFFTAQLSEALALRQALHRDVAIYVLNGLSPGSEPYAAEARITPVLNCLEQADGWAALARRLGRSLPAVLQVDSGMSRLGMAPSEVEQLAAHSERLAGLDIKPAGT